MRISDWSSDVCSSDLVTLHQAVDADGPGGSTWKVFARPARKLGLGDTIDFVGGFTAEVVGKGEAGEVTLTFDRRGGALLAALEEHGIIPVPPRSEAHTSELQAIMLILTAVLLLKTKTTLRLTAPELDLPYNHHKYF